MIMACLQHINQKNEWRWQIWVDINITLNHKVQFMTTWEFLGKGSRPRGVEIRCYWKTYSNLDTTIGFTWIKRSNLKRIQGLLGLHERLVLLKDLSKLSRPNRTYMMKIILKRDFSAFSGWHKGLVLLKDLPKLSMPNSTYMSENHFCKGVSMPFGFTQKG